MTFDKGWYEVDNVSKVFLATQNERDTRTLRVSCTLKETVDGDALQSSLLKTIKKWPYFQVRIRRGFFWHYMEHTDVLPVVQKEGDRICPCLYGAKNPDILHYKVSYYENRINLDMFHVLSDGTGALEFLNMIVLDYLKTKHSNELADISVSSGAASSEMLQNSYRQFYDKKGKPIPKPFKSYHLSGLRLPYNQLAFYEIHLSAKEMLAKSKAKNTGLTAYLGARLMMSIYEDMPYLQRKQPITIGIPVNLRNYYPSKTIRNFFNNVNVSHKFTGVETVEDLAMLFEKELKKSMDPEMIKGQMDHFERMERVFWVRAVPLFIKQKVVKTVSKNESKAVSAVISNLGVRKIPEKMEKYIETYSAFCAHEELFMTVSSYKDDLVLGVSQSYVNTGVLKSFVRSLTEEGIGATVYASGVIK